MSKAQIAVIIFGPPGSGKGTQANLLAENIGIVHFDPGKYLERMLYKPKKITKEVLKMRKVWEAGKLIDSKWVTKLFSKRFTELHRLGYGVVSSGSPRTLYEAERLFPHLTKLYGKRNIYIFRIKVPEEISLKRNSNRMLCSVCAAPVLTEYYNGTPEYCPFCGGKLYKRNLDNPETIKQRLEVYRTETQPIFGYLKKEGFKVVELDGKPAPYKVFKKIYDRVENSSRD